MYLVYKITRDDGKIYIGTTNKKAFKNRMCGHKAHKRFKNHTFDVEILEINDDYDYIMKREVYYINKYDSYYNGLNETIDGKGNHLSEKFTTKGYKYSEKSKMLMKKRAKERIARDGAPFKGKKHSPESKIKMSKMRKGKQQWTKLKYDDVVTLLDLYEKRVHIDGVGKICRNGKKMSYRQAFALKYSKNIIYHIKL